MFYIEATFNIECVHIKVTFDIGCGKVPDDQNKVILRLVHTNWPPCTSWVITNALVTQYTLPTPSITSHSPKSNKHVLSYFQESFGYTSTYQYVLVFYQYILTQITRMLHFKSSMITLATPTRLLLTLVQRLANSILFVVFLTVRPPRRGLLVHTK
jgi:hypothetical protein